MTVISIFSCLIYPFLRVQNRKWYINNVYHNSFQLFLKKCWFQGINRRGSARNYKKRDEELLLQLCVENGG